MELISRVGVMRENLHLSQEPAEELKEELIATWSNFFTQLAENGSEDHVLEICWMLMVQNWKLVEKLHNELKGATSSEDQEQIRNVLNKNLEFKHYVDVSYEETEVLTKTFIERMTLNQE